MSIDASDVCETKKVVGQDGKLLIINRSDYDADPSKWTVWDDAAKPAAPSFDPSKLFTMPGKDGRYYVVDQTGVAVPNLPNIEPGGYDTEEAARAALASLQSVS